MEKKGIIAIVIVAVIAIAVIGLVIGSTINQSEKSGNETYYYIDGNGGKTNDGETKVEWKKSSLPDDDYFTLAHNHYMSFNTQSDGSGTFYSRLSSDAPKGSTLYVYWEYNYVALTANINDSVSSYLSNIDVKNGSTVKHYLGTGNPTMEFGGKDTNGVFDNHIEITVKGTSSGNVSMVGNVITVSTGGPEPSYQFTIVKGATVEVIDLVDQNKGLKLTFTDSAISNSHITMNITMVS